MRNLSIKHKSYGIIALLFLAIFTSGMVILLSLTNAQKDAEIMNALGRQGMLAQEMAQSVFGFSMAKGQKKNLEQQILSLDRYITQMRKTYTESVIGQVQKAEISVSMNPASETHPAIPFPATFTRIVNEKFADGKGFFVNIISENPVNPKQNLKSELDKEANAFLKNSSEQFFSKIVEENGRLILKLYSADRATATACASCHSTLQNKKVKVGDILGIRSYKLDYAENIALGKAELNASLNQYDTTKTMFEFTLLVMKLGGEFPLDRNLSQWRKAKAIPDVDSQNKILEIEKEFHVLAESVETLLHLKTNSMGYRRARQEIVAYSNTLRRLSGELVDLYELVAKKNHQNIKFAVVVSGAFVLLVLIGLARYFSMMVIKPVQHISTVLKDMASGNLKQETIIVKSQDEIGILAQSCNEFVDEIQSYIGRSEKILTGHLVGDPSNLAGAFKSSLDKMTLIAEARRKAENALREAQVDLESRVKQRTSELLQSNESLLQEITLREKSDEALQANEVKMQTVLDNLIDGIITINEDGIIQSFNLGAQKIFGYSASEILGQNVKFLMPEPFSKEHDQYIKNYIKTGVSKIIGLGREVLGLRKNGTTLQIDLRISEMYQGENRFFTGIVRDITKEKFMQTQLNHAQKMESIGQLAAGMAHEINTPMQFVGDNTMFLQQSIGQIFDTVKAHDRLLTECKKGTVSEKMVEEMKASCQKNDIDYLTEEIPLAIKQSLEGLERVGKIVKAMKEFSHPGSEEKIPTDFNKAIETTLTVAKNEWKYVAEVVTDFDPNLPLVPCFANDFNQVILNTVVNAAHAIGDVVKNNGNKGIITIRTRQDGDWAEVHIQDTGTGIPENIRSKIFDPFFTSKEVGKGTGQGLSIVHSIMVKKHQGTVSLETEEGKGTTFIFRFPLHAQKQA